MISNQQKPDKQSVTQAASGSLIDRFRRRREGMRRWAPLVLGAGFLLLAVTILIMTAFDVWNRIHLHGRAIALSRLPLPIFIISLILPLGVILIYIALARWESRIDLYDTGFAIIRNKHVDFFLWVDIIRFDAWIIIHKLARRPFSSHYEIILEDEKGKKTRIPDKYQRINHLIQQIRERLLPILFARAEKTLIENKTIQFHPQIKAKLKGLEIKNQLIPWNQLNQQIHKNQSFLLTHQADNQRLIKTRIQNIRNLEILRHLIDHPPDTHYVSR